MKKIILYLQLISCYLIVGCAENKPEEKLDQNDILKQIEDIHNTFLIVKETNPNATLTFSMTNGKLISRIDKSSEKTFNTSNKSEPLCKGDGIRFAKCVKEHVDDLGCVRITSCRYCAWPCD